MEMAPTGKRKRNERGSVDSSESRPSPHRPGNTNLGQRDREPDGRDGRRSSRGGGGGSGVGGSSGGGRGRRNDRRDSTNPNKLSLSSATATPTPAMSPPPMRPSSATSASVIDMPTSVPRLDPTPFDYT